MFHECEAEGLESRARLEARHVKEVEGAFWMAVCPAPDFDGQVVEGGINALGEVAGHVGS